MVRHFNALKIYSEGITQKDKEIISDLDHSKIKFSVSKEDFSKTETKNNIFINVFGYENKLTFPIHISDQNFENSMDLLLIIDENKSHYVYIKDFERFMFHKSKNKNEKYFCKSCLQCLSSKNILNHKEVCLSINSRQSVKLEKGTIEFKNYFQQIPVSFKIYADCEWNLTSAESYAQKKYQEHIPCSFSYKLVCVDDRFSKPTIFTEVKMLVINLLKRFLKSMNTIKK